MSAVYLDKAGPCLARARVVNQFLRLIASCGRRFFHQGARFAEMDVDRRGLVWFIDAHRGARIYTHRRGPWKEFSEGGTMETLVCRLRDYIRTGKPQPLDLGPWPNWICEGDLWGYGGEMQWVRDAARSSGIWLEKA